jgi:hypothetical protein
VEASFHDGAGDFTLQLVDVTGRVLNTENGYTDDGNVSASLDLQRLSAGLYYVRLIKGEDALVRKLMKQ